MNQMAKLHNLYQKLIGAVRRAGSQKVDRSTRIREHSYEEACELAMQDYKRVLGKKIIVDEVDGYEGSDSTTASGEIIAKVLKTNRSDICRQVDEFIDPYWDVKVISGPPAAMKLRSTWVYGPSYKIKNR